jgi:hypothetical protein
MGPDYVLHGYENEMTLVSQKMSVELQSIERALRSGQITHDEAEYLIQQRYQVAMMQYEVFTAYSSMNSSPGTQMSSMGMGTQCFSRLESITYALRFPATCHLRRRLTCALTRSLRSRRSL